MVLVIRAFHFCITNLILIFWCIHLVQSQTHFQTVTLTPTNNAVNGSYILNHIDEVDFVNHNRQWRVKTYSQNVWHFIMLLDHSWGFHASKRSKITFHIDSPTVARPHTFNDLLFGFTLDNKQYLSMWIPMRSNGDLNQIYPGCDTQTVSTQTFAMGDIASLPDYDRNCDIAGGSCSNWIPMVPQNHHRNQFPISITFENNPDTNTSSVSFTTAFNALTQTCGYVALEPNKGLKMYFGGNERGEQFLVNSFRVEQAVFAPTARPTKSPTLVPTHTPSKTPSLLPTYTPTVLPIPQRRLTCGDTASGMLYHAESTSHTYVLNIPGNVATLTLDTCNMQTTFETTIALLDDTMSQVAFDSNGCNDAMGRSKLVVSDVSAGMYSVLLSAEYPDVEGLYKVSVSCTIASDTLEFCNMFVGL